MGMQFELNDDPVRPKDRTVYTKHWAWARGGRASCSITRLTYARFVSYTTSTRAPGDIPSDDPSEVDACEMIAHQLMMGLVAEALEEDAARTLLCSDKTSAVLVWK